MGKLRSVGPGRLLSQTLDELTARPRARVLDIGAGRVVEKNRRVGLHALAARYERLQQTQEYIGLEIDTGSSPSLVGDAHLRPFADATMDGVLMVSVLEHLHDPIRAVDEVHRVLRPDGIFFSYAPFYHPYHASPHDYFRFTLEGYRYLLRNFSEVRFVSGGNYIAVLNDVVGYPFNRAGRAGRALSKVIELALGIPFLALDDRLTSSLAAGFGARACK